MTNTHISDQQHKPPASKPGKKINPFRKARREDYRECQKSGYNIIEDALRILNERGIDALRDAMDKHPYSTRKAFMTLSGGTGVFHMNKATIDRLQRLGFGHEEIMILKGLFCPYDNDVPIGGFKIVG